MSQPVLSTDVDAALLPVSAGAPAGTDLRYQAIFDEIKTARRLAEADPTERAPWKTVTELLLKAMTRSKDLQLGVWLLEALARIDGFRGASTGLVVLRRLLDEYWESVYPQLDPDDTEPLGFRRALLDWVDGKLAGILKSTALTGPPSFYGLVHYEVTQKTGDEKKALLDEGWPSAERFNEALQASAQTHLEAVLEELIACEADLAALQATVDRRFNAAPASGGAQARSEAPKFVSLSEAFATARWLVERPLQKRRKEKTPPATSGEMSSSADASGAVISSANGDQLWTEALNLTRGSRVDGLRLLQTQLAAAISGRERFLRQLQLAELSLEAGVYSLAFPVFDDLARTIDNRKLQEWEDKTVVARVFKGLVRCCGFLKAQSPAAAVRETEALGRLASLDSGHTA